MLKQEKALLVWVRLTKTPSLYTKPALPQTCRDFNPSWSQKNQRVLPRRSVGGWWQLWPFTWDLQWKGLQQLQRRNAWGPLALFFFFRICNSHLINTCNLSWICVSYIDTVSIRIISLIHPQKSVNVWDPSSYKWGCTPYKWPHMNYFQFRMLPQHRRERLLAKVYRA